MSANALLLWMSARRQGSWQQFRAAVERLHLSGSNDLEGEEDDAPDQFALTLYQTLWFNLQRIGHAEFFSGAAGADWRVTPPSLAVREYPPGLLGILVGARSPALLERLHRIVEPANAQTLALPEYPDQIMIAAPDYRTMTEVAESIGLLIQRDAPAALLACLPPVDDASVRCPAELPFGADWRIDHFSSETLRWRSTTLDDAASARGALFRFSLQHQRHMLFCEKGTAFRIPGQVGKYLVLRRRRRQVLRYDAQRHVLEVPPSCRPPFLVERALILSSGAPPSFEGGALRYGDIPESIARTAASLLRQGLQ